MCVPCQKRVMLFMGFPSFSFPVFRPGILFILKLFHSLHLFLSHSFSVALYSSFTFSYPSSLIGWACSRAPSRLIYYPDLVLFYSSLSLSFSPSLSPSLSPPHIGRYVFIIVSSIILTRVCCGTQVCVWVKMWLLCWGDASFSCGKSNRSL